MPFDSLAYLHSLSELGAEGIDALLHRSMALYRFICKSLPALASQGMLPFDSQHPLCSIAVQALQEHVQSIIIWAPKDDLNLPQEELHLQCFACKPAIRYAQQHQLLPIEHAQVP